MIYLLSLPLMLAIFQHACEYVYIYLMSQKKATIFEKSSYQECTPLLDLMGHAAQQSVLYRKNHATGCPFLMKIMIRAIMIAAKTIDKRIVRRAIMWMEIF